MSDGRIMQRYLATVPFQKPSPRWAISDSAAAPAQCAERWIRCLQTMPHFVTWVGRVSSIKIGVTDFDASVKIVQ